MYRNYVITDLYIPYDILQDKRFTLEEKFLMAVETQYPKILREDIASIMNITVRQVSNHRKSINKKLKGEINFPKEEENFPKTPKTNTDANVSPSTADNRQWIAGSEYYRKALEYINENVTEEKYEGKKKNIEKLLSREQLTDEEKNDLREKVQQKVDAFKEK